MNIDNKPQKTTSVGDKIVHDIRASLMLPSVKFEIDRALLDYNNEIERKVSASVCETILNFDLDLYIDIMTKDAIERKFKQAIEYEIHKRIDGISSTISQAAYDIVNNKLGDE